MRFRHRGSGTIKNHRVVPLHLKIWELWCFLLGYYSINYWWCRWIYRVEITYSVWPTLILPTYQNVTYFKDMYTLAHTRTHIYIYIPIKNLGLIFKNLHIILYLYSLLNPWFPSFSTRRRENLKDCIDLDRLDRTIERCSGCLSLISYDRLITLNAL